MPNVLTHDVATLHRALASSGDEVSVRLSRKALEWLTPLAEADASGIPVVIVNPSRPQDESDNSRRRRLREESLALRQNSADREEMHAILDEMAELSAW